MTQEGKELLLIDLCARLPYNVVMTNITLRETTYILRGADLDEAEFDNDWDDVPYLRPLSSMTEEEMKEYHKTFRAEPYGSGIGYIYVESIHSFDWLNKHGFDYRGLIPKGLALSTEVFNPYKD